MTNVIFKIIAWTFVFNISVGIMTTALPSVFTGPNTGGVFYQANYSATFNSSMQQIITPSGELEDRGNQIYRVLDLTIIGFIERALNTLKSYLYGFVQFLDMTFGSYIAAENPGLRAFLFQDPIGVFYILTTIGYIYGAFYLWTGKNLTE
jgi:hypothetical protein